MKTSLEIIKQAGLHPKLRLFTKKDGEGAKSTGSHKVKLIADKRIKVKDQKTNKVVDGVRYLVEENGETKTYDTKLLNSDTGEISYFVLRMAEIKENEIVLLEGKQRGVKNYVQITSLNEEEGEVDHEELEVEEEDK